MDVSSTTLRILREIADRGSFTAAAEALGYSQSAVSRVVAAAERATGARLFERSRTGTRPTGAGSILVHHAAVALDALDLAQQEMAGGSDVVDRVRVGHFPAAGAALVPRTLARLRVQQPRVLVTTREGATPSLVRALRSGSLDLVVISSRAPHRSPDQEAPALAASLLLELHLAVAVSATGPLAKVSSLDQHALAREPWITSPAAAGEPLLGTWPGLAGKPRVVHRASDWTTKLALVASGSGITTFPPVLMPQLPPGVRVVDVHGLPPEVRQISAVRQPGSLPSSVRHVVSMLAEVADELARENLDGTHGTP